MYREGTRREYNKVRERGTERKKGDRIKNNKKSGTKGERVREIL